MAALQRQRHEKFVREYLKNGGNGAEAYRRTWAAFPNKPLKSEDCARVIACRILKYPEVQARYKELQAQMAKRADITEDKILSDYQHALELAKIQEKPSDIVNAATAQAKLVGLLRDRVETGGPGDFESMEDISEIIESVRASAGDTAALALMKAFGLGEGENNAPAPALEADEADLAIAKPASDAVN